MKGMIRILCIFAIGTLLITSCRSTRNIQTAITRRDSVELAVSDSGPSRADTINFIQQTLTRVDQARIDFTTFSAKINVDYQGTDGKKYDVNANLRMYKDSVIWISITAIFGIEGLRAYITPDSVHILNKQDKIYTARSVNYLQEVTALPLDLRSLQDIIIGNPVFLDSNIVSFTRQENSQVSLLSIGDWFKNFLTLNASARIDNSKLDDADRNRSRTCNLSYTGYEEKKGLLFSTRRRITVAEKSKLDIKLDFKSYEFNETLSFPFSVPKSYKQD